MPAPEVAAGSARWDVLRRWVVPLLVMTLLVVVMRSLEFEVAHLRYHELMRAFRAVPRDQLLLAALCTVAVYVTLPAYDYLALVYAGYRLPWRRVAYGSTVTYGISQTLGFAALTGGSLRVRLWSAWGLDSVQITRAVAFASVTFVLGVTTLTGLAGLAEPTAALAQLRLPIPLVRGISGVCVLAAVAYVALMFARRGKTLRIRNAELSVPGPGLVAGQLLVSAIDWTLAALVLYVLLPDGHGLRFPVFVGVFLLAQTAGLISHVPGGLGVFESMIVLQAGGAIPTEYLLASLLAYRAVFYGVPFIVAVAMLTLHEARRQGEKTARAARAIVTSFERWAEPLLPTAIGVATMAGGAILLLSGATPSVHSRLTTLHGWLPLGLIELSHFTGSVVGTALLVLGWALTRRLDGAYHLARILLVVGIGASLSKGLDVEEALVLAVVLALVTASHAAFYRRSSLLAEPLTPGWIAAIVTIVAVSVWVGMFSFKHVDFTSDLWWRFAMRRGDAPRFLRASAGAATTLGIVAALRLFRGATPQAGFAGPTDLARIAALLPTIEDTSATLALLGDKHVMFSAANDGFIMYGVSGRSWVVLSDPFGPASARRALAWRPREKADEHGAWPVFYEVSAQQLPLYIDLGLTLFKMGEEASVPLPTFSLDGGSRRGLRRTQRELQKVGATFEIVPPEQVPALLPELRAISDEWLAAKATREKGFSLGRFDETYLAYFPHAIVRINGRIVAFANVLQGAGRELSVDLMRYANEAPRAVMEYLFIELMLWGRANGFERFRLGMAPLSGLEARSLAPKWHRIGGLLYRHGEHFYNFRGLRAYKEKFDPVWEPRYLAAPAGLALPRILANVSSLISGGITGLFVK